MVSELIRSGGGRLVAVCTLGNYAPVTPCGRCRQLLWEHGGPALLVEVEGVPVPMTEILPHAFPEASNFTNPNG
jgi:cytidine deaminase